MWRSIRGDNTAPVTELSPQEPARFNPDQLEDLCNKIGEIRAEAEVALALHRISAALPKLQRLVETDVLAFADTVDTLIVDADMIGMATLARVGRNVQDAFASGNAVALAATLARLERVGDRSVHAVWDLEDLSV